MGRNRKSAVSAIAGTPAPTVALPQIDSGLSIPKVAGRGKPARWQNLFNQMSPGDSVLLTKEVEVSCFQSAARRLGGKLIRRTVDGGIRVWKGEIPTAMETAVTSDEQQTA